MTRILAIDPGNEMSARCVLVNGEPVDARKEANGDVIDSLRDRNVFINIDVLAIEMIASYGMAVGREVFDTCLWIGRFDEAWRNRGGAVRLVYRREVKMHLCGNNAAKDANIRQAIIDHFGPGKERAIGLKKSPGPLYGISGDEWSALAVALTCDATRDRLNSAAIVRA